ncbi:RluA family pseudouridine synthase [Candidatus Latescibacterota bacterium]
MPESTTRVFTVGDDDAEARLDVYLTDSSGQSRSRIKSLMLEGFVTVNGDDHPKPSYRVETGDRIELREKPSVEPSFLPEKIDLDIVYEDEHIIVINKPAGMVVHPARGHYHGTLASGLLYHSATVAGIGEALKPGLVHRLDMDTSGLLVAALTEQAFGVLSGMIHDREVERNYTAFVWGHPEPRTGTIDAPIGRHPKNRTLKAITEGGRPSVTNYDTLAWYEFLSKLDVSLKTGRTHQIRVHLESCGHHVFGDHSYGGRDKRLKGFSPEIRERARFYLKHVHRQALHASRLAFDHPVTGKQLDFEAPLPDDLAWLQTRLNAE